MSELVRQEQGEPGEEGISDDDEYRGNDNRLGGSATDALGAAAHVQTLVTADGRKNEGKDDRLGEALH